MDTQRKIKIISIIVMFFIGTFLGHIFAVTYLSKYNPKDEIVVRKCIDGYVYATNNKGYKRQLLSENNSPLRCDEWDKVK